MKLGFGLGLSTTKKGGGGSSPVNEYKQMVESDGGELHDAVGTSEFISLLKSQGLWDHTKFAVNANFGIKKNGSNGLEKLYNLKGSEHAIYNPAVFTWLDNAQNGKAVSSKPDNTPTPGFIDSDQNWTNGIRECWVIAVCERKIENVGVNTDIILQIYSENFEPRIQLNTTLADFLQPHLKFRSGAGPYVITGTTLFDQTLHQLEMWWKADTQEYSTRINNIVERYINNPVVNDTIEDVPESEQPLIQSWRINQLGALLFLTKAPTAGQLTAIYDWHQQYFSIGVLPDPPAGEEYLSFMDGEDEKLLYYLNEDNDQVYITRNVGGFPDPPAGQAYLSYMDGEDEKLLYYFNDEMEKVYLTVTTT